MKLKDILGNEIYNSLSDDVKSKYEGKDLIVNDGSFVPKERFDEVNKDKKEYKTQLSDLKAKFKDNEELQTKITELENQNQKRETEYTKKIEEIKFNSIYEKEISNFKPRDSKLILSLLNKDNLKIDGENITGLKEQLENIKKEKEYLFEAEIKGTGKFGTGKTKGSSQEEEKENFATKIGKAKAEQLKQGGLDNFLK